MSSIRLRTTIAGALAIVVLAGCGLGSDEVSDAGNLLIYTTVTQDTVDAVLEGFEAANPDTVVEVFRAPTGEVAARIATELRGDGLQADVLWMTDPLSVQQYARDGLLREWTPAGVDALPDEYRTPTSFGTRVLNLVIVAGSDIDPVPADWADLSTIDGTVALPDPGFAGSAFAALGFFALTPEYGMDFYRSLEESGAVQVQAPDAVVVGVAEGLYAAGITLDRSARVAVADGSPIELIWPESGAIALYSPIAVVEESESAAAEAFVNHALGVEGQTAIAETGWQPVHPDVEWDDGGPSRTVDWAEAFDRQEELVAEYRSLFGE